MRIKINEENDLYNSFDEFDETLSDDLITYISNKDDILPAKEKEEIEIVAKCKIDEDKFKNAFSKYCEGQMTILKRQRKLSRIKQVGMLVVGILFIIISLVFENIVNAVSLEIISTIGSFSIWESANSWLLESKEIKFNILKAKRLKESEIKFTY